MSHESLYNQRTFDSELMTLDHKKTPISQEIGVFALVPPVRLERTRPKRTQPLKLPCMPIPPWGQKYEA